MRTEWNLLARRALMAALACVALVALTSCGGGGGGGSNQAMVIPPTTPPPTTPPPGARGIIARGSNGCSNNVNMRFFQYVSRASSAPSGQWPSGNNVYVINPGSTHQQTLACTPGRLVCYGGTDPNNPGSRWGVGIDGDQSCTDCCKTCPSTGNSTLSFGRLECTSGPGTGSGPGTSPGTGSGTEQPLQDITVTIPSSCSASVEVCVRDHACEDGDAVRVSVNGSVVFSGEIFNNWQCRNVPVRAGSNSIDFFAINGTGFKGNCSFADSNTGQLRVRGGSDTRTQSWSHRGGAGSSARLNVNVGPPGGSCTPGGTTPPPTTRRLYGAIAFSFNDNCAYSASIASPYTSENTAESNALSECRRRSGTNCRVIGTFGSAYSGNNQCGAVAYGESGNQCRARVGRGSTESAARADALATCRSGGYSCNIIPGDRSGGLVRCAE